MKHFDYFCVISFLIFYRIVVLKKEYKIVIITLYFPVSNHHHTVDSYLKWAKLFFRKVDCDIIFYTNYKFKEITSNLSNIHTFSYPNITAIPIIYELDLKGMIKRKLLQIYHSKVALLYYASLKFKANIYFFNDISTFHFRDVEKVEKYPNKEYISSLFNNITSPIFFTINHNKKSSYFIQGGCFGGNKKAVKYLFSNYYLYLNMCFRKYGIINITEETLLDSLIYTINDSILIPNNPDKCNMYRGSVKWFYYINVLSGFPKECVKSIKLSHLDEY